MHLRHTAFIVCTIAALAAVLTAAPAAAKMKCENVLAKVTTTWVDEGTEVGEVAGLINGALYLRYSDKDPAVDPGETKPNMVINTKGGDIHAWVAGTSTELPDGAVYRELTSLRAYGTEGYANAVIHLSIVGECYPYKEGGYELVGTICRSGVK